MAYIEFVKEHLSFTGEDSPTANLMLGDGRSPEFEAPDPRARQREGIALAKQRGLPWRKKSPVV